MPCQSHALHVPADVQRTQTQVDFLEARAGELDEDTLKKSTAEFESLRDSVPPHELGVLLRKPLNERIMALRARSESSLPAVAATNNDAPVLMRAPSQISEAPSSSNDTLQRALTASLSFALSESDEAGAGTSDCGQLTEAVSLFREPLDLTLAEGLAMPRPFSASLAESLESQRGFISAAAMVEAEAIVVQQQEAEKFKAKIKAEEIRRNIDSEVVQEQEQEKEQEQQQQQQKEQETVYDRNPNAAEPWEVSELGLS